jgi:hypothetical protein
MFSINEDLSIYATRGDAVFFSVSAVNDITNDPYEFQIGDILRMSVCAKKDTESVLMRKDIPVESAGDSVFVYLDSEDTKFGDPISKPTDYWYEIELNPGVSTQTLIGYDEDGPKLFKLFPESGEGGVTG